MQYSSTEGRNYATVAPDRAVPLNMDADGYDFPEGARPTSAARIRYTPWPSTHSPQ